MIYPDNFEQKTGFDRVRKQVKTFCLTSLGKSNVDVMAFDADPSGVRRRLEETAEMVRILQGDDELPLSGFHDLNEPLRGLRVGGAYLSAQELQQLRASMETMGALAAFFGRRRDEQGRSTLPRLDMVAVDLYPFPELVKVIDKVLDRSGEVLDTASPELYDIRRQLRSMAGSVAAAMRRVLSRAQKEGVLDADTVPAMRDGRLVIPVAPMHKRKLQGIVHDESGSGKTVYIEPAEVVEANNRIRELEMEERREIIRILVAVAAEIRPRVDELLIGFDILGELDFIRAKALYAGEVGGEMPHLADTPDLEWYHACHPVLLGKLKTQGKEIVPLDITLTPESRILVISGPNAGGKSVCLKTVGIVQYMLQSGLLPPVHDNSRCGVFADIFLDIGDDQSIEDDLSTYSSHLRSMRRFVQSGSPAGLMLIDEFGGGTEPTIGGAIAQSLLRRFNELGMWGVVTTHYRNLKQYAEDTPGLINGSMLYDRGRMQPLFKLSIGNPGSSFALEIARQTGLPQDILAYAEELVGSEYIRSDSYLLDIARDRRYWENKRIEIRRKERKLEETLKRYETEAEELRAGRRGILAEAKAEAARIIDGSNAAVERAIREIREANAERERTLEARNKLREERRHLGSAKDDSPAPELLARAPKASRKAAAAAAASPKTPDTPLAVGDYVKLDGNGTPGRILAIEGKQATVAFGMLRTTAKLGRLKRTAARPSGAAPSATVTSTADASRQRQLNFKSEIDVRGMRVDEAVQAVTYFIDDAIQFNAGRVRILHGTGTGALRDYLRRYLATVPGVKHFADEHVQFGGAGITVVDLD